MDERVEAISHFFLGKPYLLGPLGEGFDGKYDQSPLYRTDAFDCITYVETVLAIALGRTSAEFRTCINHVRYQDGNISYTTRNHFPSLDWNPNNQRQNYLVDITKTIHQQDDQPIYKIAEALIDKPSYYKHLSDNNIHIENINEKQRAERLSLMRLEGEQFHAEIAQLPYLPLSDLFDKEGHENDYLFNQIPNASIIEIVRPNWDLTSSIGTHQNLSHIGFVFKKDGKLIFRDASQLKGAVSDTLLVEYLRRYINHETIKGINIQLILPKNASGC